MKSIVKYTCFFIVSLFFCLFINASNVKASSDYTYFDNGDEVTINLVENNITTYGEFIHYISIQNNITKNKITVYKKYEHIGWKAVLLEADFKGDNTVLLDFLPSNTCLVSFNYSITLHYSEEESYRITSNGHKLPNLNTLDKEGYVFKGWYTYINSKYVKINVNDFYINKDNMTFFAEYTKKKDYKAWIIVGCVCFIAISSTITYFIKKKEKVEEK